MASFAEKSLQVARFAVPLLLVLALSAPANALSFLPPEPYGTRSLDGRWRALVIPQLPEETWAELCGDPDTAPDRGWSIRANRDRIGVYRVDGDEETLAWSAPMAGSAYPIGPELAFGRDGSILALWDDFRSRPGYVMLYGPDGTHLRTWSRDEVLRGAGADLAQNLRWSGWVDPRDGAAWLLTGRQEVIRLDVATRAASRPSPEETARSIDALAPWIPGFAVRYAGQVDLPGIGPASRAAAANRQLDFEARLEAARCLWLRGDHSAQEVLLWSLEVPQPHGVSESARLKGVIYALELWAPDRLEQVEAAIRDADKAYDGWVTALARGGPAVRPMLERFMNGPDTTPNLRSLAEDALEKMGHAP